jgi:DNA helicase-2/ATP-dependent DNA helicase PcrA
MQETELNYEQKEAVNHKVGPMLVVAGAGTGKTKVIVERTAKLIRENVKKSEILALTFTEKAAQEMLDRVSEKVDKSYGTDIPIHTFNGFGQMIIAEFAVEIGLSNNQKLIGEKGKVVFMRENLDELDLDYFSPVSNPDGQLSTLADYFSELKQQLITPEIYANFSKTLPQSDDAEKQERKKHLELASAYGKYISLMRMKNIIDYDDQIYLCVELLKKRANIARKLRERYSHIMVDEFQDTNPMQSELIDLLYGDGVNGRSLMVVGDDDQAIYGWRGATLDNILNFSLKYKEAKQITLIKNYRNTQNILDCSWNLIQNNNPNRLEYLNNLNKKLIADRGSGVEPEVNSLHAQDQELSWISDDIKKRIAKGQKYGNIAILARSRRLVEAMHQMLDLHEIPHMTAGLGEDLFDQQIILMMVDCLKAIWHPGDNQALYHTLAGRLFDYDSHKISEFARIANSKRVNLYDLLKEENDPEIKQALQKILDWRNKLSQLTVREMSYEVLTESGLKDKLYKQARHNNKTANDVIVLSQWFRSLLEFEKITTTPSTHSYLQNFSVLRAEGEILNDDSLEISGDNVAVMTMHKAKGLEWGTVYVIGCNSKSFPYLGGSKGLQIPEQLRVVSEADSRLSEERRLMYVSATRARDELIITCSNFSSSGKSKRKPSPFIKELGLAAEEKLTYQSGADIENHRQAKVPIINIPSSMREGDNIILSASQAEDYLYCPYNFYFKHILGVFEEPNSVTAVGSLYHNIIESINQAKINGIQPPSLELILARISNEWPETGYQTQKQRQRDMSHAINNFPTLYDRLMKEPAPLSVEHPFKIKIPDSNLILKGRIDAVKKAEKGIIINDYKTSTTVTTLEKAADRTKNSKQLTMYAVAWQIQNNESDIQVSLDFVRTGQIAVVKKLQRSIDGMTVKLQEVSKNILKSSFPLGSDHELCIHP